MVDDEHADVPGQPVDGVEDDVALGARHAGRRLVEQQHLRLKPERDRQLDQALAAVGQLRDAVPRVVRELQGLEQVHRLLDHVPPPAGRPEHGRRRADALGDREVDVLEHREPAEQPVDLERPGDAELDAFGLGDARDVAPFSSTWPDVGGMRPVRRLTNVVLPAPFGPISAWRAPASSRKSTSRAAASAPKVRQRPRVSSRGALIGLPHREGSSSPGLDSARRRPRAGDARPRRCRGCRSSRTAR